MSLLIPSSVQTMTSEDLFRVVNEARAQLDEPTVQYSHFTIRLVDELEGDENFDYKNFVVKKLHNGTERSVYTLTIEQCMLVAMRESKAVRRAVLHKLKELESKVQAVETDVEVKFNMAAKFASLLSAELNLPESGKLTLFKKIETHFGLPALTPSYGIDAPPESIVTTGSSAPTFSLTTGLKGYPMSARTANQILITIGILEERTRPSTKKGEKTFKAFTADGLRYGKNVTSPSNPREVQPHFYVDTFPVILSLLGL